MEVVVKQLRHVRQYGERRIHAHCAHCLGAFFRHGHYDLAYLLICVAECAHARDERQALARAYIFAGGQIVHVQRVLVYPVRIRMALRNRHLELFIAYNATFDRVNQQHATRAQAALV